MGSSRPSAARAVTGSTAVGRSNSFGSSNASSPRGLQPADAHRLLAEGMDSGEALPRDGDAEGSRLLILLADRDPFAAEFAEFFLRTEGYEVVLAHDAVEAERGLRSVDPTSPSSR